MDKKRIGTVAVVCLLVCSAAQAGLVLDQFQEGATGSVAFRYEKMEAQTFTPGISGVLAQVDLGNTYGGELFYPGVTPPVVEIYDTTPEGQPGPNLLGSGVAPHPIPSDGWVGIDLLSEGIHLTAGEMYAIVFYPSKTDKWVTVGWSGPGAYGPGALWSYDGSNPWVEREYYDIQFRTYMVPAPGAALLGMIGLGTAGWFRKRRAL